MGHSQHDHIRVNQGCFQAADLGNARQAGINPEGLVSIDMRSCILQVMYQVNCRAFTQVIYIGFKGQAQDGDGFPYQSPGSFFD